MIFNEQLYAAFVRQSRVGNYDEVAISSSSYVSYLNEVSVLLGEDISPEILGTEADIACIVSELKGCVGINDLLNFEVAMRHYVAFSKLKLTELWALHVKNQSGFYL